jgi:hypothetical protein
MADERTKIQLERELARERRLRELADERASKMRQLAEERAAAKPSPASVRAADERVTPVTPATPAPAPVVPSPASVKAFDQGTAVTPTPTPTPSATPTPTPTPSLKETREANVTARVEDRAKSNPLYDLTQRPQGGVTTDNTGTKVIVYYGWIGGRENGQWEPYKAEATPENIIKYGARSFGGETKASFDGDTRGTTTLKNQPTRTIDASGQPVFVIGDNALTVDGFQKKNTVNFGTTSAVSAAISTESSDALYDAKRRFGYGIDEQGKPITTTITSGATTGVITGGTTTLPFTGTASTTTLPYTGSTTTMPLTTPMGTTTTSTTGLAGLTAERRGIFDVLTDRFSKYGLSSLVPKVRDLIINGATEDTITIQLQETPEYQRRFRANQDRIKKGLSVLTPAEYLNMEDAYRQILRSYGLNQFDTDDYVSQFISNDISAAELSSRVVNAVQRVRNADPAISQTLREFYGIGQNDLVAYVLDPNQQLPKIERQIAAAEIGTAARRQGIQPGVAVAEQLAAQGITQAEAQRGYATIADILPTAEKLSQIYKGVEEEYNLAEAEQEVFNTLASAQRKRQRLVGREVAQFSGQAGLGRGSLGTATGGQY